MGYGPDRTPDGDLSRSAGCCRCIRLADHLAAVRTAYPGYHARPVESFGDPHARLLIVGLAPGLHGANATGRPFTGDHAGIILYETLHDFGFASAPVSVAADDGLSLVDCRISNAVRCLPPQNKPLPVEVSTCNDFLVGELARMPAECVVLALGRIAHDAVLMALGVKKSRVAFAHGVWHRPLPADRPGLAFVDSYHCSRYNTNTRRLTPTMFREVFAEIRSHLDAQAGGVRLPA